MADPLADLQKGCFQRVTRVGETAPSVGTPSAFPAGMHTIFFSLHRADLCSIAFQREILRPFGLTPARYLMLLVIWKGQSHRWMQQNELRRQLGVTAATVCKMVRALVDLGLLRRKICLNDRRTLDLELTELAIRLLRVIQRRVIAPGYVWIAVYSVLRNGGALDGEGPGLLKWWLERFRTGFRDRARFELPWCNRTLFPRRPRIPRALRASGAVFV